MTQHSRTSNSLRNARAALLFYALGLVATFVHNSFFIRYIGTEVLGLNSLTTSLLGFLNVAELGLSSAIAFVLYRPLASADRQGVNDIISIQLWFYRLVALIVGGISICLLPFFPQIFAKTTLPLYYAYSTYAVLLANTLLGYLFTFKQVILSSDQREDQVTIAKQGSRLGKQLCQILAMVFAPKPYLLWLVFELVWGIVHVIWIGKSVRKLYPWLEASALRGRQLYRQYPEIMQKMGQIVYHKIAGFALNYSPTIVIYLISAGLGAMLEVTLYQNYLIILSGIQMIFHSVFSSITASVGNLILERSNEAIERLFRKVYSLRIALASIVLFGFIHYSSAFINLWLGENLVLSELNLYLFALYLGLQIIRLPDQFLAAYGMYQDIYAPIIEVVLNLGLSILLGFYWGLTGVLIGINISLIVVVLGWKTYFLYRWGFRMSMKPLLSVGLLSLSLGLSSGLVNLFPWISQGEEPTRWTSFLTQATLGVGTYSLVVVLLFALYYLRLFGRKLNS